ncbi:polysaccharide deacetylase family protein [Natrialbaceae archaeon AArc-T1-2]|uniref:polysaccharide deacetylase family protein n=1 Tax=Natrialbaceae archaeon AArc-T1-2 TaxID=3053904 RepID=UPI00255AC6CB|nr:polysaccharide deacetylase family protein [Natrialbaceae archaeon AArc-T1-2]WIV67506.1 polysaccharide deacetylase family protein [Natrialbaceae archaeon AArc-T1-2]
MSERVRSRSSTARSSDDGPRHTTVDTTRRVDGLPPDAEFALCLTHDVDRPYKGLRSLYYATQERPDYHLQTALSSSNPYWQFEELMAIEDELGVRSSFYFLNEQHLLDRPLTEWVSPANWVQHLGRYDVTAPEIEDVIRDLDAGGWEVGLHGSYHTPDDPARLSEEKTVLEDVLGRPVIGGRQHHLRLTVPDTWRHHRAIGLSYDASLGSPTECGFHASYRPLCPFGDEFLVFPLTIMDQALPDPGADFEAARRTCEQLLTEAAANDAVMTVLWHPRFFSEREFPGHRKLYRWLVERALSLGAWVGSPRDLRRELEVDLAEEREGRETDCNRVRERQSAVRPSTGGEA